MKSLIQKIVALYTAHGKFYSFVIASEFAAVSFVTTYSGGLPSNKDAWFALASGLGGALWGAAKAWLQKNIALPTDN